LVLETTVDVVEVAMANTATRQVQLLSKIKDTEVAQDTVRIPTHLAVEVVSALPVQQQLLVEEVMAVLVLHLTYQALSHTTVEVEVGRVTGVIQYLHTVAKAAKVAVVMLVRPRAPQV
jgi:hypothetical protein